MAYPQPYTQTLTDALAAQPQYGINGQPMPYRPVAAFPTYRVGPQDYYAADRRGGYGGNEPGGPRQGGGPHHGSQNPRSDPNRPGAPGYYGGDPNTADPYGGGKPAGGKGNARQQAVHETLANLLGILASHGETDPAALNRQLTDISQSAQSGQNQFDEYAASQGLGGSGVAAATHAAIGAAGGEQRSRAIAAENAAKEERKRQDLLLTLQLILNPRIARRGQDKALAAAIAGRGKQDYLGALGNILGGLGNMGGGSSSTSPTYGNTGTGYGDYANPADNPTGPVYG